MADIKKRTLYTAYSRTLSMAINIASQFVLTPIILSFLGTTLYGVYTIVIKANNFLSIVDIRPTAILRLRLAYDQVSDCLNEKRKYIGASYIISIIFFPIFLIGGGIFAWVFPDLFHIEQEYVAVSRIAIILLSLFLAINSFLGVPEAILRGNNLEYKGFFVEPIRLLLVAALSILFLYYGWGLLSVIYAMFAGAIFAYISRLIIQRRNLSSYTALKPEAKNVRYFFQKGGWYLLSSFLMQTINNFDVILIGMLLDTKSVTIFAITKAIIFRVVESMETLVTSTTSSVGEIVGSNDKSRMQLARKNLFNIIIPLAILISSYFYIFNEAFIDFWTGQTVYAGNSVNILICLSAIFLMLTSTEEIFILSVLDFRKKAFCLLISAVIAIGVSILLNRPLGLIGNAMGILFGRLTLFVFYYEYNNRLTGKRLSLDYTYVLKICSFIIAICLIKYYFNEMIESSLLSFIIASFLYLTIAGGYSYMLLLPQASKNQLIKLILKK